MSALACHFVDGLAGIDNASAADGTFMSLFVFV
jgi:hypothetical protein